MAIVKEKRSKGDLYLITIYGEPNGIIWTDQK